MTAHVPPLSCMASDGAEDISEEDSGRANSNWNFSERALLQVSGEPASVDDSCVTCGVEVAKDDDGNCESSLLGDVERRTSSKRALCLASVACSAAPCA